MKNNILKSGSISLENFLDHELEQVVGGKCTDYITLNNIERVLNLTIKVALTTTIIVAAAVILYNHKNILDKTKGITEDIADGAHALNMATQNMQQLPGQLTHVINASGEAAEKFGAAAIEFKGAVAQTGSESARVLQAAGPVIEVANNLSKKPSSTVPEALSALGDFLESPGVQNTMRLLNKFTPGDAHLEKVPHNTHVKK